MEGGGGSGSEVGRRTRSGVRTRSFDSDGRTVALPVGDSTSGSIREMPGSQLAEVPVGAPGGYVPAVVETPAHVAAGLKVGVEVVADGVVKRKRGRPPRAQGKLPPPKRAKEEDEEEDVCFICFDGGDLVLCDRKGCPKAYHPTCVRRDEAFFRSKAKWNCGWHICSLCEKAAHFMCYMCTYSLCKGCTKKADYVCVRENKGFCATCIRMVTMIENGEQGNKGTAQVDFDDQGSWEYLFKLYWVYLRAKLSLTFDELTKAKSAWGVAGIRTKQVSHNVHYCANIGMGFISESACLQSNNININSCLNQPELPNVGFLSSRDLDNGRQLLHHDFSSSGKLSGERATSLNGFRQWASKELLEFIDYEKNGDTSILSQFEVQALLLDYIKRNNLCDSHIKSQIHCDSRLINLFGKSVLGHFEMLKLLESHIHIKEDLREDLVSGFVVDPVTRQVKVERSISNLTMNKSEKIKPFDEGKGGLVRDNGDEYAAIDVHNVNLIYLWRGLLENLLENSEEFNDKVVGSIVRIKLSSSDPKEDMYKLVQVVGTSKVSSPYKIGDKTVDFMLKVLDSDKIEIVSVDAISNQQFSEEECRHLRKSVKCGLMKRLTVGEVKKKATSLRAVRLSNWLETEVLGLNHPYGTESENGQRKEVGENIDHLKILKTSEEYKRRLHEVLEVHIEEKVCANNYESEDDACEVNDKIGVSVHDHVCTEDAKAETKSAGFSKSECESKPISRQEKGNNEDALGDVERMKEGEDQASGKSESTSEPSGTSKPLSTGDMPIETDKVWYYRDPHGDIRGPFAMFQFRKWSTTSLFPPDMRIWIGDGQNDAVLLSDALNVQFHNPLLLLWNASLQTQEVGSAVDGRSKTNDGTGKEIEGNEIGHCNDATNNSKEKTVIVNGGVGSCTSECPSSSPNYEGPKSCSPDANHNDQAVSCSSQWDSSKGNSSSSDQSQVHSPLPSSSFSDCSNVTLAHQETARDDKRWNPGLSCINLNSHASTIQITAEQNEKQYDSLGCSVQFSGPDLKPKNFCLSDLNSNSDFTCLTTKTTGSSKQDGDEDWDCKAGVKQLSTSSNVLDLFSSTPNPIVEDQKKEVANRSFLSSVQNADPGQVSFTSLLTAGTQHRDGEEEYGGASLSAPKPSVEQWHTSLVSVSSLKPTELVSGHIATPTSRTDQHMHSSPTQPSSNICTWSTIISEPIEFSTLAEESVSDLLAEVDAMEFQSDLASPTSRMRCIEELFQDPKNECFGSMEELSPPEPGKADAFSSTAEMQLPSQSTILDESVGACHANIPKSCNRSITSAQVEEEIKSTNILVKKIQPSVPSSLGEDSMNAKIAHVGGSKAAGISWRTEQGDLNMDWEGSAQAITNMDWEINHIEARGALDMNHHNNARNLINHHTSSGSSMSHHTSTGSSVDRHGSAGGSMNQHSSAPSHHSPATSSVNHHHISAGSSVSGHHTSDGSLMNLNHTSTGNSVNHHYHTSAGSSVNHHHTSSGSSVNHQHSSAGISVNRHHTSTGSSAWDRQRKYGGERLSGSRDGAFHGGNSGFSRGRLYRQSYGDNGGSGWHSRPPTKVQRVCKYYESGHCRKGAMCDYLHP